MDSSMEDAVAALDGEFEKLPDIEDLHGPHVTARGTVVAWQFTWGGRSLSVVLQDLGPTPPPGIDEPSPFG